MCRGGDPVPDGLSRSLPPDLVQLVACATSLSRVWALVIMCSVLPIMAAPVHAGEEEPTLSDSKASAPIEEVLVIGSRSARRSALDSPAPVDVFQAEDLRRTGALGGELGEALQMVAPSFNFPRQSNSGTSDHIRAGQLRGMSPDQMLVLVNGKRRHPSSVVNTETKIGRGTAAVDFNAIPMEAVSRVEVLRDGAGAQYGSDAIAGVVNLILDDRARGIELSTTYGEHVTHEDAIGESFSDGETFTVSASAGIPLGERGFLRFGATWSDRGETDRAGFDQIPFFIPQTAANLRLQGRRNYSEGDPEVQQTQIWINGEREAGEATLYLFGTASFRDTEGDTFFRYPDESRNVPALYPDGFLPRSTGEDEDAAVTFGATTPAGLWKLDASVSLGHNEFSYGVRDSLNASLGPSSPTSFDSGTYQFRHAVTNLNAVREFAPGVLEDPVSVAVGLEHRHESFESAAGDPASFQAGPFEGDIGAQGAPGLTPADAADDRRDVLAAYVDTSSQLTPRLFANVAARVERYSDFGETYTGRLSAIYDISDRLAIRGTMSSNIRAPALSQINFSDRTLNFGEDRTLVSTVTLRPADPLAAALGVRQLDEESARNWSLGVTAQPSSRWNVTVDAFSIHVDDRITLSERFFGPALEAFIAARAAGRQIESVRFFANAVDTRTEGVELVSSYGRDAFGGELQVSASVSYAQTDIRDFTPAPAELRNIDPNFRLVGVEEINTIEEAAPETKGIAAATWSKQRWRVLARWRYYDSTVRVFNFGGGFEPRQRYSPESALDLEVGFRPARALDVVLGVNNLTDNYPDESDPEINFFGNLPYDILSPIGVNGRFVYTRLDVEL